MSGPQARKSGGTILGGSRRPVVDRDGPDPDESADPPRSGDLSDDPTSAEPSRAEIEGPGPGSAARGRPALLILCALLATATVAMALVAVLQHQTVQRDRARDRRLRDVSGQTVAALTTYDYQQLDTWRKSVLANLTGTFAKTFDASVQGYEQVYVAEHNRGTSTIEGVWIGQTKADQASTVVLVRITVTSLTGTHTIEPYVQLNLLKVGGRWQVDDVQYTLDSGNGGSPAPPTTVAPHG